MHLLVPLIALFLCFVHFTEQCQVEVRGVDEAAKQAILRKHNEYRAKIANGEQPGFPQASNMQELVWDDAVAQKAQQWAEKCNFGHDDQLDRDTGRGYTGQNIAVEDNPDAQPNWDKMIQMFYDEVSMSSPSDVEGYSFNPSTGHFTQIVWGDTNKIGCGYVRYKDGHFNRHLYGCNYLPGGNVMGQPMYQKGEPCSQCGGCGPIPGLCKSQ